MTSHQDDPEAGPSGLSIQEMFALVGGLDVEDDPSNPGPSGLSLQEMFALVGGLGVEDDPPVEPSLPCEEILGDSEEDDLCMDVLDRFERQRAFQSHLLQQTGGGALDDSEGTFDFDLDPYVDRLSRRMGVRERHFKTQLRQRGNFIGQQNIVRALQEGLRRAVNHHPQPARSRSTLLHAQFQSSQ